MDQTLFVIPPASTVLAAVVGASVVLLVAVNGLAALLSGLLQFGGMLPGRRRDLKALVVTAGSGAAFVSVHVPTYDEPPELVIATLHSLAALTAADFEVIIVDNNTADEARWRPVAAAAATLGQRFRFYHFDRVDGAKAGALNLALQLADARTTHVAVVDADYQVSPDFLGAALSAFAEHDVDYVQFPQAYRHVAASARGVERELGDYFACFKGGAARAGSMLPTGTLSVFAVAALRSVGGWSAATITEDAELGVRLQAIGRKGLWLAAERGAGVLPLDFAGLTKQRARWVAGNVQVLLGALRRDGLQARRLPLLTLVTQLTAWVSFWLVPAAALALLALFPTVPGAALARPIAAATIVGSAGLSAVRMFLAIPTPRHELRTWAAAVATKLALTWTAALAWLPVLAGRTLPFERTLKQVGSTANGQFGGGFAASAVFFGIGLIYAAHGQLIAVAACGLLAAIWPCSLVVDANLRRSAQLNPELI